MVLSHALSFTPQMNESVERQTSWMFSLSGSYSATSQLSIVENKPRTLVLIVPDRNINRNIYSNAVTFHIFLERRNEDLEPRQ